jgi:hypothetical protein
MTRLDAPRLGHEQRVPQVARRVVRRDVEQLEVVGLGLDFGSLEHLEAVGVEDLAQVAHEGLDRVQVTDGRRPAGRRHVDRLGRQAGLEVGLAQGLEPLVDGRLELTADLVRSLPHGRALLGGHRSQLPQERGELPRSAEQVVS